ncbi:MAG: hypothetical protein HEP71_13510 [Roseivirga sp.]|nr:hypothetical protein [Roseivirga sp.]
MKTKVSNLLALVFALLVSCQTSQSELEIDILNDILPELLSEYSDIAPLKYSHGARTLFIYDSFTSALADSSIKDLYSRTMNTGDFQMFFEVDTIWRPLVMKLTTDDSAPKSFEPSELNQIKEYEIVNASKAVRLQKQSTIGVSRFSHIFFSENKTRACFYYSFLCNSECGEGYIVFAEKVGKGWKIAQATNLWVS